MTAGDVPVDASAYARPTLEACSDAVLDKAWRLIDERKVARVEPTDPTVWRVVGSTPKPYTVRAVWSVEAPLSAEVIVCTCPFGQRKGNGNGPRVCSHAAAVMMLMGSV